MFYTGHQGYFDFLNFESSTSSIFDLNLHFFLRSRLFFTSNIPNYMYLNI